MYDPTLGATGPLDSDPDLPTPEPPVYKRTNHTLHLAVSVMTAGFWVFGWWAVHAHNKRSNERALIRYHAALSEARHAAWQQRYGGK